MRLPTDHARNRIENQVASDQLHRSPQDRGIGMQIDHRGRDVAVARQSSQHMHGHALLSQRGEEEVSARM